MNQDENNFISLNINTDEIIQINSSDYCDVFRTKQGLCIKKVKKNKEKNIEYIQNEKKIYEILSENLPPKEKKNIIKYYCGGEDFIILKYAPKYILFKFMEKEGLDENIVKILFYKILSSINEIHKCGVCHLDLKPDNILLDKNYEPKIMDFGYSAYASEENQNLEKLDFSVGSPFFQCPEMILEIKYNGKKADIFSLGINLYYTLKGFKSPDKFKLINEVNYKDYLNEILKDIKNNYSNECYSVIEKMIKEEEKDRPSIEEILTYKWFDDIKKFDEEHRKKIIFEYFSKKEEELKIETEVGNKEINRPYDNYEKIFQFLEPKKLEKDLICYLQDIMKINGNLDYIKFMNLFVIELKNDERLKGMIEIKPSKTFLEFELIIRIGDERFEDNNDLIMKISLIEIKEDRNNYYINTVMLSGSNYLYYYYKDIIYEIAKDISSESEVEEDE